MMMQCMQCSRIISGLIAYVYDKDGKHAHSHPHLWQAPCNVFRLYRLWAGLRAALSAWHNAFV